MAQLNDGTPLRLHANKHTIPFIFCLPLTTPISPPTPSTGRASLICHVPVAFSVSEKTLWNVETHSEHVCAQAGSLIK